MTTLLIRNSNRPERFRGFLLIALACFALATSVQAVSPAPDGGYANGNTAEGTQSLFSLTTGVWNTAIGYQALYRDTSGHSNTAEGVRALFSNTTGIQNTATGVYALHDNTTGANNVANGYQALESNTTGNNNTAAGLFALSGNTTASFNTAIGWEALSTNTTGGAPSGAALSLYEVGPNTAVGAGALLKNVDGGSNTAVGYQALGSMTSGITVGTNTTKGGYSTAVGFEALASAVGSGNDGIANDAFGYQALVKLTTGSFNVGIGTLALGSANTGGGNTAVGPLAGFNVTTGVNNVFVGLNAGSGVSTADGVIAIRNAGENTSFTTWISGIYGVTTAAATTLPVIVSETGQLGTAPSSRRFKKEIKPMDKASEAILALKPVTFHYKSDSTGTPQFGLIAEEVAEVNPGLVARDDKGEIYSVRYDQVNAMLLNEFLKEHRKVEELNSRLAKQEATIAQQQKGMEAVTARLDAQDSKIQKVSDKVELSKSAPRTVSNR
jgi:hypothetical protein